MAEIRNSTTVSEEETERHLNELKRDLEGWREVLIPLNGLMNWEKPYHPAIIIGFTTFIFTLIWYFEPSILTTFSLLGLAVSLIDFLVPMIGPNIVTAKWTAKQEQQYETICIRIHNAKVHFISLRDTMCSLKSDKPKTYFVIVMGTLILLAWVGSRFDNLCMTYVLINLILLVPGVRRHGILQKYFSGFFNFIKSLVTGKGKKSKTN